MQYIALIHKNADTTAAPEEWDRFIQMAVESGMFKGGSEIGVRHIVGHKEVPDTTKSVGGFMQFDSADRDRLLTLLKAHPMIKHGGTIELCEMPES
ncbi:MAG: hypothetical protein HYV60_02670 [Planctomycetia bacterium]|nr:hypothetical protein [Planctomycetia bacterium]